jgi:hypothetical protein
MEQLLWLVKAVLALILVTRSFMAFSGKLTGKEMISNT